MLRSQRSLTGKVGWGRGVSGVLPGVDKRSVSRPAQELQDNSMRSLMLQNTVTKTRGLVLGLFPNFFACSLVQNNMADFPIVFFFFQTPCLFSVIFLFCWKPFCFSPLVARMYYSLGTHRISWTGRGVYFGAEADWRSRLVSSQLLRAGAGGHPIHFVVNAVRADLKPTRLLSFLEHIFLFSQHGPVASLETQPLQDVLATFSSTVPAQKQDAGLAAPLITMPSPGEPTLRTRGGLQPPSCWYFSSNVRKKEAVWTSRELQHVLSFGCWKRH